MRAVLSGAERQGEFAPYAYETPRGDARTQTFEIKGKTNVNKTGPHDCWTNQGDP